MSEATRTHLFRGGEGAIEEVNAVAGPAQRLGTTTTSALQVDGGTLDSPGLVNVEAFLEGRVEQAFPPGHGLFASIPDINRPERPGSARLLVKLVSERIETHET